MTDGAVDIHCTSPSGKGRYTKTDQGFNIQFPGIGISARMAMILAVFFLTMLCLGILVCALCLGEQETSGGPLAYLISGELLAGGCALVIVGLTGTLCIIFNECFTKKIQCLGEYLLAGRSLKPGELIWCLPVQHIRKVQVQLVRQSWSSVQINDIPRPGDTKQEKVSGNPVVLFETVRGQIGLLVNVSLEDMDWATAIINKHVPMQSGVLASASPADTQVETQTSGRDESVQAGRKSPSVWEHLLPLIFLIIMAGSIGVLYYYFSETALAGLSHIQLEQRIQATMRVSRLLTIMAVPLGLVMLWGVYKFVQKTSRTPRPIRTDETSYRVRLTPQMLENK